MRVTSLIYEAAGKPVMQGEASGTCRACGLDGTGQPFAQWVKPTFTDHDKLVPGDIICAACLFCFDDARDDLRALVAKEKPQRMRNYSHFVQGGKWIPLSKGDKARMRELLIGAAEVAVIAISGQKHLAFRCPPGWWQIEDATVEPFPRQLEGGLAHVEALYQADISKTEIETGRYIQRRILSAGIAFWQAHERIIASMRGSTTLQLALFLAQRADGNEDESGASDDSRSTSMADLERNSGRLQDEVRAEHLESVRGQSSQLGLYQQPE